MGDFLIKNVPEPVRRAIERAAQRDGRSLSAAAIGLLQRSIADTLDEQDRPMSAWEELRPLLYVGPDDASEQFSEIMDEVESARKRDFGRPVSEPGT